MYFEDCCQVEQGLALGDLCRQLCTDPSSVLPTGEQNTPQKNFDRDFKYLCPLSTSYSGCQKMHGGKSIVFHATFHGGQDVVVKARTLDLETEAQGSVHYSDETGTEVFPLSQLHFFHFHFLTLSNRCSLGWRSSLPWSSPTSPST